MRKLIAVLAMICGTAFAGDYKAMSVSAGTGDIKPTQDFVWSNTNNFTNGIVLVAEPEADNHAATRLYVDSGDAAGNLLFWWDTGSSNAIPGNYYDMTADFPSAEATNTVDEHSRDSHARSVCDLLHCDE